MTSPNLWTLVDTEKDPSGADVRGYTTLRWAGAAQNDFAARMQWTLTPRYTAGNHEPHVGIAGKNAINVSAGSTLELRGFARDPDGDRLSFEWWQYREEGPTRAGSQSLRRIAPGRP
jgi:Cellulose-binding protein Sde0182, C-terminal domain